MSGLLFGLKRSGFLVAIRTLSLSNSSMRDIEYHAPLVGAVWIVTRVTVRVCHGVVHMLPLKGEFVSFMALFAERRNLGF